jgi:hypothetical protein
MGWEGSRPFGEEKPERITALIGVTPVPCPQGLQGRTQFRIQLPEFDFDEY